MGEILFSYEMSTIPFLWPKRNGRLNCSKPPNDTCAVEWEQKNSACMCVKRDDVHNMHVVMAQWMCQRVRVRLIVCERRFSIVRNIMPFANTHYRQQNARITRTHAVHNQLMKLCETPISLLDKTLAHS